MTTDPDVDDATLSYLHAVDAGGDPDPADWLARYPQFADQLAPFFAVARGIARITTPTRAAADDGIPDAGDPGGRYEWGEEIGRGGMGVVVRGVDTTLRRPVAVKVLQRRHREHAGAAARFLDEARIAGGLQHPGVPSVHDIGTTPDGRPFLVMRLIEGATLADLLRRRPAPAADLPRFLKVFEQVAQTVAYAHSRGVLHRDLKPANVMVGAFGEVQVMDWGLAKEMRNAECGTRNENRDPSSDFHSAFRIPHLLWRAPSSAPPHTWPRNKPAAKRTALTPAPTCSASARSSAKS